MSQPINQTDKWYTKLLTPQSFVMLMGAVVAVVLFWYRTQESWLKLKEVEDRVNRQYQTQREMNDAVKKEVQEIRDEMKYREGYEQAKKDLQK